MNDGQSWPCFHSQFTGGDLGMFLHGQMDGSSTLGIAGLTQLTLFLTGFITHLLGGVSHQI